MSFPGIIKWLLGFFVSCLFIWGVSALFLDSVVPMTWDSELDRYVRMPGTVRTRSEGWADRTIGRHGMGAESLKLLGDSPCVVVWGDSNVDAMQVGYTERFDALCNARSPGKAPRVVGLGGGGLSVADYYFLMPRYQKTFPNIVGNAILLSGMGDVLPDGQYDCHSRFESNPFRFVYSECEPSGMSLEYADDIAAWRLEFAFSLYRLCRDVLKREGVAPPREAADTKGMDLESRDAAMAFLVDRLTRVSAGFLAFIYCPLGPQLVDGVVEKKDSQYLLKEHFKKICEARGVYFLDMTEPFNALASEYVLPRGFFNTPQGVGHFNQRGHEAIARALREFVAESGL